MIHTSGPTEPIMVNFNPKLLRITTSNLAPSLFISFELFESERVFNRRTDGQTDGHGKIDLELLKDPEYIYFMGSQMNNKKVSHGMTNLIYPHHNLL